ncbi:Gp19/Gp15/Gp42-like protein [Herbihabitans rhizosphaerae]|uniref:Gp19/Gp15/Gp42-like protein n=1 Tax=Herbihabitans rhizosphaerae TaxID=1872711 RepID=A0A4Q7KRV7_9PSEU|nr:Gp19/Gp15/Gp42-like protein [Herbihabitans rhizosphaerae]
MTARLADIEAELLARIPNLVTRANAEPAYKALVVRVECDAVLRVVRNPGGYRQETAGDYSYSADPRAASGYLFVTDDEWRLLGVARGAFTIAPVVNPAYPGPFPLPPDDLTGWS